VHLQQAYLWIGPEEEIRQRAVALMKQILCSRQGCRACVDCRLIDQMQHHFVTWIVPENSYTLKQIEVLFKTVCFKLEPGNHHFIVLERADLLTAACANSLLKSLEEPPVGYHYILLAPRMEGILPTIRSRCVVEVDASKDPVAHRLVQFFTKDRCSRYADLMKEIEKSRVIEHEIDQLLDSCMHYWQNSYKQALLANNKEAISQIARVQEILQKARSKPPMPGSSKLFLKNLFLQLSLAFSPPPVIL
jgi:hypothetical protein